MCGKYRQLCHHINGEFSTAAKYNSPQAMKNVLLLPSCPDVSIA